MTVANLKLQPRLGLAEAQPLVTALREHSGSDLVIDASEVSHLGTLCLQALIAAAREHAAEGTGFLINNVNDSCVQQLSVYGLSPEALAEGVL